MRPSLRQRPRTLPLLLGLVSTGLMAGGCAAAGLALVGPLAGSLTAIADRSVERTLPADLGTAWGATADAMARMAIRLDQTEQSGTKWRLTGTGEAVIVHGTLELVTAGMTKVSVRVEAGSLFADKQTGDELLNQIAASLARSASLGRRDGTAPNADAASDQLRLLQREIQRLGTRIEQAREAPPPTTRPEASPVATVSPTAIIVVPTSAGVATVPVPDIPLARQDNPSAFRRSAGPSDLGRGATLQKTAEPLESRADDIRAAPMKSAETLRPVEALRIRPVDQ
jgi:hypothetical protein